MAESLRLDKFLWFARIVKTRSLAQQLAEQGRVRLAGRVIDRAHAPVRIGDVLSFAVHGKVRVIRIKGLPRRRGPPAAGDAVGQAGPARRYHPAHRDHQGQAID